MKKPVIKTQRLNFYPVSENDLEFMISIYTDPQLMKFLNGPMPVELIRQRLKKWKIRWSESKTGLFLLTKNGSNEKVGLMALFSASHQGEELMEIGWMISQNKANNGVATEAARGLIKYSQQLFPDKNISAFPGADNKASNRICKKIGMKIVKSGHCYSFPRGDLIANVWILEN